MEPCWVQPKAWLFDKTEIERMLEVKVFSLFKTEWATPVVFVPKMALLYMCGLSKAGCRERAQLLPHSQYRPVYWFACRGDNIFYSTLDANCAFLQVEIGYADCFKIAFTSHYTFYQFFCMAFWFLNPLRNFQQTMNKYYHKSDGNSHWLIWMISSYFLEPWTSISKSHAPYCCYCQMQATRLISKSANSSPILSTIWDMWYTPVDWSSFLLPHSQFAT